MLMKNWAGLRCEDRCWCGSHGNRCNLSFFRPFWLASPMGSRSVLLLHMSAAETAALDSRSAFDHAVEDEFAAVVALVCHKGSGSSRWTWRAFIRRPGSQR